MIRRHEARLGRFPLLLLMPVLLSGVAVVFMFIWNGWQAEQLADWWRERMARSLWEALPRVSGLSPRELIVNPDRLVEVMPRSGILAMGFANHRGWVLEPVGPEKERLLACGPFPRYGATALEGDGPLMPGGGPFEVVFLLPEQGTPPVVPLLIQRWRSGQAGCRIREGRER